MSARYTSDTVSPTPLGQPLTFAFSDRTAPNRFLKGAMSEFLASWSPTDPSARGIPTPSVINAYRHWGETGSIGVILSGNILLEYDQLEGPGNMIVTQKEAAKEGDVRFEAFKELARQAKKGGSLFVAQLNHPGRQVQDTIQPHPISASDVQLQGAYSLPVSPHCSYRFRRYHRAMVSFRVLSFCIRR